MAVTVKSEKQIALMREAGRLLAITHEELHKALKPGMTTLDIDRLGEEIIRDFGCVPNFKNYNGFPASICVSINDEVVHGIPTDKRVLKEGDIVSLDAGLIYKGYHDRHSPLAMNKHCLLPLANAHYIMFDKNLQHFEINI